MKTSISISEIDDIARKIIENSGTYQKDIESYYNRHKCRIIYQIQRINEYIKNKDINILEIGPYPGILSAYYSSKGYNVDVIEYPRPEMKYLEQIYRKIGIRNIIYHDLSSYNNIETSIKYDIVLMFEVIEHVAAHPIRVMHKISKVMNDNAILFLSTPNLLNSFNRVAFMRGKEAFPLYEFDLETTKGHFREYSKSEIKYILNKSGFKIIDIKNYDKSDYCRFVGIPYRERYTYEFKVKLSRLFFRLISTNRELKKFLFVISQKTS